MEHPYKQEKQIPMNNKPAFKGDNKIYRVQNPIRSEISLAIFFLFKILISSNVKKTAAANPKTNIIFGKVGGSWWKPEYRIIVGGKTKKDVEVAVEMLQKNFNRKKK
ncbi:MAG: hypothetical protein LLG02_04315 [Pelosinus sp.]|nr:hypothetical protein [Pelosinus sp.]